MAWANLLHFYQPYGQKRHIIDAIAEQCYRPVAEGILATPGARVSINFTGVLLDQLAEYGHSDIIALYREAAERGQVELVGSAKYHVILPLLSAPEAARQLQINDETNRKFFGNVYKPRGVFLPEMAYSPELAKVLDAHGFEWVLLDELAYNGRVGEVDYTKTYTVAGTPLKALFREHRLSATIMSATARTVAQLKDAAREELNSERYIVTAMDGETFGHHRTGHEQLLLEMMGDKTIDPITMSEVFNRFEATEPVETKACTWASNEYDLERKTPFISWSDPTNQIHKLQWTLLNRAVKRIEKAPETSPGFAEARATLDYAVSSDQFFWAAAKPWWMIEHIERGAHELVQSMACIEDGDASELAEARNLYHEIVDLAYDWQRNGVIDRMAGSRDKLVRIPFLDSTVTRGDEASWQACIDMMSREEKAAAKRGDYESAILWRDGKYKLEHRLDIYDMWYIIDLLKSHLPSGEFDATLAKYKRQFDHIRGGQVEQRSL